MAERAASDGAALPARLPRGAPKGQALRAILEELLSSLPPGAALPCSSVRSERTSGPYDRQAPRFAFSAPIVVSSPWPVWTTVSSGSAKSFARIDRLIRSSSL